MLGSIGTKNTNLTILYLSQITTILSSNTNRVFSFGFQGRITKVAGSGLAIMSLSSILAKPLIDDPSKPIPSLKTKWGIPFTPVNTTYRYSNATL